MRWVVPAEWEAERADRTLAALSGERRSECKAALQAGEVLLDGVAVSPRTRVAIGAVLEGEVPVRRSGLQPEDVPFGVLYEDQHLAVVDKPPGVVTHPGAGRRTGTLAAGVLQRWPQVRGVGDEDRWGIVHRLDRDTSGLLVVALEAEAHAALRDAIKHRLVTREYLALAVGVPEAPTGSIEAPIARDPARPTRMKIRPDGRPATTHFRVEEAFADRTLLRVILETGRTHQIRVHLSSIGLPVAGDRTYGNGSGSPRLFLHAARLAFTHPVSGDPIAVESPLPDDLSVVLDEARSGG